MQETKTGEYQKSYQILLTSLFNDDPQSLSRAVLTPKRKFPGNFPEISQTISRNKSGLFPEISRTIP